MVVSAEHVRMASTEIFYEEEHLTGGKNPPVRLLCND
jgi:hypothetical protein